jgi:hypothetical protein
MRVIRATAPDNNREKPEYLREINRLALFSPSPPRISHPLQGKRGSSMRSTYLIEAIRSEAGNDDPRVLDRMIVRAPDLESVKRQAMLLFETARAPQWTRPNAD